MRTTSDQKEKSVAPQRERDYCLTCRVPVKQCKGDCTAAQRKANGGRRRENP